PRGTGAASRYRSDPQLASLATVSPENNATTTTSKKLLETKIVKRVKFSPLVVASWTRLENRPVAAAAPPSSPPPTWNAAKMINGSATMNANVRWVRRRVACRRNSAATVRVRPTRYPGADPSMLIGPRSPSYRRPRGRGTRPRAGAVAPRGPPRDRRPPTSPPPAPGARRRPPPRAHPRRCARRHAPVADGRAPRWRPLDPRRRSPLWVSLRPPPRPARPPPPRPC